MRTNPKENPVGYGWDETTRSGAKDDKVTNIAQTWNNQHHATFFKDAIESISDKK